MDYLWNAQFMTMVGFTRYKSIIYRRKLQHMITDYREGVIIVA